MSSNSDNKRIAKNTMLLYFRMIFLSVIGLFTVRVTINALGVVDYGIYNVVGSLVTSMSFITGTLNSAAQRYFSFLIGKNDSFAYRKTFSMFIVSFILVSVVVLVVGEILGVVIFPGLKIPESSMNAAYWAFQMSVISFIIGLISIPYTSSIIAYERMNAFAYISIIDGIAKLGLVYLLYISELNKLKLYSALMVVESLLCAILYYLFCHKNFNNCRFDFIWDKRLFKELFAYTGWNLFGSVSGMLSIQGQNILLNIFFGPVVNTAKGIADKVSGIIQSFSSNFYTAIAPQITKTYATNEMNRYYNLIMLSTKLSFFLVLILAFPLMSCCGDLLSIWLGAKSVSDVMIVFTKLTLIYCLLTTLEQPITHAIRATGKIKVYQISVGIITLLFIPIAAFALWHGYPPQSTMYVLIGVYGLSFTVRLIVARKQIRLPIKTYFVKVLLPIILVSCIILYTNKILSASTESIMSNFIIRGATILALCLIVIGVFGLTNTEKRFVFKQVFRK